LAAIISAASASAIAAMLAITLLADHLVSLRLADTDQIAASAPGDTTPGPLVDRRGKTDALPGAVDPPARTPREIRSVEVVGVRGAAVVYRDGDGNLLFRTDPLANVTVVARDVKLPEITIRDSAEAPVERVEVEAVPAQIMTAVSRN
jgi:hypothetical protein